MVFVDTPIERSLAYVLHEHRQFILRNWQITDPESTFAHFICSVACQQEDALPIPITEWPAQESLRHPPSLAAFGFLASVDPQYGKHLQTTWSDGLAKMLEREPFPLDRQSFAFRPFEVLGLASGASVYLAPDDQSRNSLCVILNQCRTFGNTDMWSQLIYAVAERRLGLNGSLPNLRIDECDLSVCALIKSIDECRLFAGIPYETVRSAEDRLLVEHSLREMKPESVGRAALQCVALTAAVSHRIKSRLAETRVLSAATNDGLRLVVHLCRRFPLFARQMQIRRKDVPGVRQNERVPRSTIEMVDEYDVQESLHAILKLFFDDIRAEEWTPSYAGKHARMDFLLKRERIVIETKFFSSRLSRNDLIDQLIIDKQHYRQHDDCQKLVCLIYDPELRCQNPVALERDISEIDGDFEVTAIIAPHGL